MVYWFGTGGSGMHGRRNPFVANEGILPLLLAALLCAYLLRYHDAWLALIPAVIFVLLFLLFRDPRRDVPPVALGIVSPVDGRVVEVDATDRCVVQGEAHKIRILVNPLGTYTARSPIEGRVMDLASRTEGVGSGCPANALWIETDEGKSVVLQFHDFPFGLAPRSFVGLGERLGQGQRCANIRLARVAEVYLPIDGKIHVEAGQRIKAGSDVIAAVPHA
jgi:phosphatidylserine decarboxylase